MCFCLKSTLIVFILGSLHCNCLLFCCCTSKELIIFVKLRHPFQSILCLINLEYPELFNRYILFLFEVKNLLIILSMNIGAGFPPLRNWFRRCNHQTLHRAIRKRSIKNWKRFSRCTCSSCIIPYLICCLLSITHLIG